MVIHPTLGRAAVFCSWHVRALLHRHPSRGSGPTFFCLGKSCPIREGPPGGVCTIESRYQ